MKADMKMDANTDEVVATLCQAYADAVNAGDSDAYASLFAPDAVRIPPGQALEQGREQIRAGEQASYDAVALQIKSSPRDALRLADAWIHAIADIEGTAIAHADGARSTFRATKTWLLQQRPAGEWLIARQMWNLRSAEH